MSSYKPSEHKGYGDKFLTSTKLILKQNISKNPSTLANQRDRIIRAYNEYIGYISVYFESFDTQSQTDASNEIKSFREKLVACFSAFQINQPLPTDLLSDLDIQEFLLPHEIKSIEEAKKSSHQPTINPLGSESKTTEPPSSSVTQDPLQSDQLNLQDQGNTVESRNLQRQQSPTPSEHDSDHQEDESEMDQQAFLGFCAKQISNNYSGDPLELNAFVNSINLLKAVGATHLVILKTFLLTKLTGKALECIPDDVEDVDAIITALRANIKSDSSEVVAGKLLALRVKKGDFTEFTKQAEQLSEAFQRGLVMEGIPKEQARKMSVKKTVELCRKTARSDIVKSVISSTAYSTPSEVLAKLVTENDVATKEKKETDANRMKQQQGHNFRGNSRGNRFNRGNNRGNGRGNFGNNGNRFGSNFGNNRGQFQSQNQGQFQNRRGNFRGNGQNFRGNRNEHTIRFVTGNSMGPSHGQMVPPQQYFQQQQQQNPQNENMYHIPFQ